MSGSAQPPKIYELSDFSEPLYASTHNAGFLHAYIGAIQGLRDLNDQVVAQSINKQKDVVHRVHGPSATAPVVLVPLRTEPAPAPAR